MSRTSQNFAAALNNPVPNGQGLVDLLSAQSPRFNVEQYQNKPENNYRYAAEAIGSAQELTPVTELFFSPHNIDILQEAIRYQVYNGTQGQYTIGRQSDKELQIIMRSIYYQYSLNNKTDIVGQVKTLNGKVLDFAVPQIISNVLQYDRYRHDISTLPVPLPLGAATSQRGTGAKQLEYMKF